MSEYRFMITPWGDVVNVTNRKNKYPLKGFRENLKKFKESQNKNNPDMFINNDKENKVI